MKAICLANNISSLLETQAQSILAKCLLASKLKKLEKAKDVFPVEQMKRLAASEPI